MLRFIFRNASSLKKDRRSTHRRRLWCTCTTSLFERRRTTGILNRNIKENNIANKKLGYYMTEDDLAYLADQFNKNLTIIPKHKNADNNALNTAIIYWKNNRPTTGVIHEDNHWTPAVINRESTPITIHNTYMYTVIPDVNTFTKHINRYLDESHNRLNLPNHNEKKYPLDKYNTYNTVEIKNNDVNRTPILGQIVNQNGVKPNPEGLAAIKNFPTPKTIKQTRSFLGLCNFFRKFIPRYAELISPITDLMRGHHPTKKSPIQWSVLHQNAFEKLKNQLTSPPFLKHFNPNLPITIWTDASKISIAGTKLQKSEEDKRLHPVSFISRRFTTIEEKYSAIELELGTSDSFYIRNISHIYIYGVEVEIWTDHAPLRYLDNIKTLSV
ncbi:Retrovirus-related Pol polyprotein [Aphis craccivora]|uniref:Retrovirus-related Pol polyprotein n=1 Tax=Aphis craccivora TaxID=307492 RepID=A0A6G0VW94_APHCR|nr:Retrovirus-related Pol polyprotein [Aphis craccivora]